MKDDSWESRSRTRSTRPMGIWPLCAILLALILSGCATPMQANLTTRVGLLGWGEHETILSVPLDRYTPNVFDRLPDLSLITGIRVQDYQVTGWRGVQIHQAFLRLSQLSGDPQSAHFLNKIYPGNPMMFDAHWRPGLLTRELEVTVRLNPNRSDALAQALTVLSSAVLQTRFSLELPGQVTEHNGQRTGERTVVWTLTPSAPQQLHATARVVSLPFLLSATFACMSLVIALLIGTSGNSRNRPPARPRPAGVPPSSRPTTIIHTPPASRARSSRPSCLPSRATPAISITIAVLLGIAGLLAVGLGILSFLDGDWVPLATCAPGAVIYGFDLWKGVTGR